MAVRQRYSPDFRVSHESLFESDRKTVGFKWHKIMLVPDGIHVGGVTVVDSVAFFVLRNSPTVMYAGS